MRPPADHVGVGCHTVGQIKGLTFRDFTRKALHRRFNGHGLDPDRHQWCPRWTRRAE